MSNLSVDPSSDVAPFEQVRAQIAGQVAAGRLAAGQKLPTVRALAADLGLAVNTVARAYRELEADGIINTEGRRGTFVHSRAVEAVSSDVREAAGAYATTARRAGLTRAEATRLVEQAWSSGA
jgi:DNA-binding transcriptional regulator YhcF (GntR family)